MSSKNSQIENKTVFNQSGMTYDDKKLDFGFFPFGTGILNQEIKRENAEIEKCSIMVLGNDFGTKDYLENKCDKSEKETNSTIKNLLVLLKKCDYKVDDFFCTNFYLGVRDSDEIKSVKQKTLKTTNLVRITKLQPEYKELCFKFFNLQLEKIKPRLVICLGNAVRNALLENITDDSFANWRPKSSSLKSLYHDKKQEVTFNGIKFIVIPHPCDTRNFDSTYIGKISDYVNSLKAN